MEKKGFLPAGASKGGPASLPKDAGRKTSQYVDRFERGEKTHNSAGAKQQPRIRSKREKGKKKTDLILSKACSKRGEGGERAAILLSRRETARAPC